MGFENAKSDANTEEKSFLDKQSKSKKKSETSDQRLQRNTRFLKDWSKPVKAVGLAAMVGTAWIGGALGDQSHSLHRLSDSKISTSRHPASDQQSRLTVVDQSERSAPALPEHPKGPTVEEIWPGLSKLIDEQARKHEDASKNLLQGEAQERQDRQTSSEQRKQDKGKGHPMSSQEQIATLKAVVEKASKDPDFAARVSRKLAESGQVSEQKSSETERRKLDVVGPTLPCLQDGVPKSDVTATGVPVEGGGTALNVAYSLRTINTCQDTISNVQFIASEVYTCPAGCTEQSGVKDISTEGIPSSIGQGIIAMASPTDAVYCMQTDANGGETPTVPTSLTVTFWPQGIQNSNEVQGTPITRYVYP